MRSPTLQRQVVYQHSMRITVSNWSTLISFAFLCTCLFHQSASLDPLFSSFGSSGDHQDHHKHSHKCIHDELEQLKNELGIKESVVNRHPNIVEIPLSEKRSTSGTNYPTFQSLRIYIATDQLSSDPYTCYSVGQQIQALYQQRQVVTYTCAENDVLTDTKKNYLVNILLKKAVGWLQSALNVVRGSGKLKLSTASCTSTPLDVPVGSTYQGAGVDADFIIFVTARPILGGSTLAFASTCSIDNLGRPIAGHANFNTSNLVQSTNDLPRQAGVATHEISHALGFSSSRWQYGSFISYTGDVDSKGNYQYVKLSPDQIYQSVNSATNAHDEIVTKTVVDTVSIQFGFAMTSAPLEDGGSSGTAGSHWEKRVFMNEYMTGSEVNWPVYSNITLALFQDSGWYTANYNVTETLLWGRGLGQNFAQTDCGKWTTLFPSKVGFCSAPSSTDVSCNYDRRGYGVCNIIDSISNIPSYFQHYSPATRGGQSMLADYCGYIGQEGVTTWCNIGATSIQQASDYANFLGLSDYGEVFGVGSRCMTSTLYRVKTPVELESLQEILIPAPVSARCYNATCVDSDNLRVQVDGVWYPCNSSVTTVKPIGFGGLITCPPASEICIGAKKDDSWPVLTSLYPARGKPSTVITLTGKFNVARYNYTVFMEVECTNVKVLDNETIIATIPDGSHFISLTDLAIFQTAKNLYVKDSDSRTDLMRKSFIIQVDFDAEYLRNLFNWMSQYPLWAFIVWLIILLPIFCCCCIIYKCCCKKSRKPKRSANHEYTHEREYYDDDYEVDDYYDHNTKAATPRTHPSSHNKHNHNHKQANHHNKHDGHKKHDHKHSSSSSDHH